MKLKKMNWVYIKIITLNILFFLIIIKNIRSLIIIFNKCNFKFRCLNILRKVKNLFTAELINYAIKLKLLKKRVESILKNFLLHR